MEKDGVKIEGEEWQFPRSSVGDFLAKIKQPLGLGEVELSDGRLCHGFLCEAVATGDATDIITTAGWRNFQAD